MDYLEIALIVATGIIPIALIVWTHNPDTPLPHYVENYYVDADGDVMFF
jgi:hypothetical protein